MSLVDMSAELLATYANLGSYDGERYHCGEECLGEWGKDRGNCQSYMGRSLSGILDRVALLVLTPIFTLYFVCGGEGLVCWIRYEYRWWMGECLYQGY